MRYLHLFLLSSPIALVVLLVISRARAREMDIAHVVAALDVAAEARDKEWNPHRLGACIVTQRGRPQELREAAWRLRRLYPAARIAVLSGGRNGGVDHTAADFSAVRVEYTEDRAPGLLPILRCVRAAANGTQVVALLDDRTWTLALAPAVPEGTVGLVGHRETVDSPACGGETLAVRYGSLFLSAWVLDDSVLETAEHLPTDAPDAFSQLVRCSGVRLSVDARVARRASELLDFDDTPAFLNYESFFLYR